MIDPNKIREALTLIVAKQTPLLRQGEDYIWRPAKACVDAANEILVLLDAPIEDPLVTDKKIRNIVDSLEDAGLSDFLYVGERVGEIYEANLSAPSAILNFGDYDVLYDHLKAGGEALVMWTPPGKQRRPALLSAIYAINAVKEEFIDECIHHKLQWVGLDPRHNETFLPRSSYNRP